MFYIILTNVWLGKCLYVHILFSYLPLFEVEAYIYISKCCCDWQVYSHHSFHFSDISHSCSGNVYLITLTVFIYFFFPNISWSHWKSYIFKILSHLANIYVYSPSFFRLVFVEVCHQETCTCHCEPTCRVFIGMLM